jgi:hypothetical protein
MTSKSEDGVARAIQKLCRDDTVRRANAALPQFHLEHDTPDSMLDLMARLDEAARKASKSPRWLIVLRSDPSGACAASLTVAVIHGSDQSHAAMSISAVGVERLPRPARDLRPTKNAPSSALR